MAAVEKKPLALFNDSLKEWKAKKITAEQFSSILDTRILTPWRAEEKSLEKMKRLSGKQLEIAASLSKYMRTRGEGWGLLLEGVRTNDLMKIKQSREKSQQAELLVKAMGSGR